ncbi:hypothetical protein J132_06399 [Termitomyces sp. J132]|nr:hypothetical protein H2248_001710 [Termitomyces sp. 'cryptogamus']KNZ80284.1 hypothetical protein J132_06399 [Termitomyces sp. J132]
MDQTSEANSPINNTTPKNSDETRQCTKCKARVPVADPRKWCANCREKARLMCARRAQRKHVLMEAQNGQEHGDVLRGLKRKLEDHADATQQEKKRPKPSHVSGEIKRKADGEVKKKKKTKQGIKEVEYQTASEMYTKLSHHAKTENYFFNGHFSIIANPETDNNQRVRLVAKDLRKVANISFEGRSISATTSKSTFCATFQCTCLGQATKPAATLYTRDPNAIGVSSLGSDVHKQTDNVQRCKGTIRIMSEENSSHPLGIAGQKITVTVEH